MDHAPIPEPVHDLVGGYIPILDDYLPTLDDTDAGIHGYVPIPDIEESGFDYYEKHKDWLIQRVILKYSKMAVKKGVKKALTVSLGGAANVIVEAPSLSKTSMHITALNTLLSEANYDCLCPAEFKSCNDIIHYLIQQKSKKFNRKVISMIPGVSTLQFLGHKGRALYKAFTGTLGQERSFLAHELHKKTKTCPLAQAAVAELLGSYHMQRCWATMYAVRDWDEGWRAIEDKMAST